MFMKRLISAAFAIVSIALPTAAHAQTILWPTPDQLSQWLQTATIAQQRAQASCPAVEVAPGVTIAIPCPSALPQAPPNVPYVDMLPSLLVPPAFDLRTIGRDGPVKDQQQTGVCYAFAMTTVMEDDLRRNGRTDVIAPLHIVAADAWQDLWRAQPREAITTENVWPYDPVKACRFMKDSDSCEESYGVRTNSWSADPRLVIERERARQSGVAFVGHAKAFKKGDFVSIVSTLAQGRAIYISIDIDSAAWGWRGIKNGVLSEYDRADRGGHGVALVGYRTVGLSRQFLIHNSWGPKWGDGGYAWISEDGLRKHLLDAYLIETTLASPQMQNQAPPNLITTCPSGLLAVMGQCWLG